MALSAIRGLLQTLRDASTAPDLRSFIPDGCLSQVFQIETVIEALSDTVFDIPAHKHEYIAKIVCDEYSKIFAILLELHREELLTTFIENDISDSKLPLARTTFNVLIPDAPNQFERLQHEYTAYQFKKCHFVHKRIPEYQVLPFIRQTRIGGGGFSSVFKVQIHPSHQDFVEKAGADGVSLIRKELRPDFQDERAEAELLRLLRSLRHPNIVELLASYTQNSVANLIFHPADMDLHEFLLRPERSSGFAETSVYHKAMHGLSDGLRHLHNFQLRSTTLEIESKISMHGYHHDIKPRNVLVRGTSFILADFGSSRMKETEKPTSTLWKNTTFDYGAPECRDPETLNACRVGRPLDIWSLACIFTEIVTYMEHGSQGVIDFRQKRLRQGSYGELRCFHDDECLNPIVRKHLYDLEERTSESSTQRVLCTALTMFATIPGSRIQAEKVEEDLACAATEALLNALLKRIESFRDRANTVTDQNLLVTRFYIETSRLQAWAGVLGVKKLFNYSRSFEKEALINFTHYHKCLADMHDVLSGELDLDEIDDTCDFVLSQLSQTNRELCQSLSLELQISIDQIFLIITAKAQKQDQTQDLGKFGQLLPGQIEDESTSAAIRHMTLRLEKQGKETANSYHIEPGLLREEKAKVDLFTRPQIHFRRYGNSPGEERKVLVEIMPYWLKKRNSSSEDFQHTTNAMFSRVQDLVEILQIKSKAAGLRILECLGTYHAFQKAGFGLVYGFPSEDTEPIRLNKLLRHRKQTDIYPHLGQKLVLAKAIVGCVQKLHTLGWVHKSISSLNVLFFYNPTYGLADIDFAEPFLVGLDHSRRDGKGEYSQGTLSSADPGSKSEFLKACKEYLHPDYRLGSSTNMERVSFSLAYDYHALGLLLLEIGTWGSLSNIYDSSRRLNYDPRALRQEYIEYCSEHLGKGMGPIFQSLTEKCLRYDDVNADQASAQLWLQNEVVDQLNRCVF